MCVHCKYIGPAHAGAKQISGRVGRLSDRRSVGRTVRTGREAGKMWRGYEGCGVVEGGGGGDARD